MENNQENKEKFYALYWGQEVFMTLLNNGGKKLETIRIGMTPYMQEEYLELKNLKDISDEDLMNLTKIFYRVNSIEELPNKLYAISTVEDFVKNWFDVQGITSSVLESIKIVDYLRSKGYLVPWMDLSCEEIIKRGWVKYK